MIRIPYPIPEPERARLIAAGTTACWQPLNTPERADASKEVGKIIADITKKYGIEQEETK